MSFPRNCQAVQQLESKNETTESTGVTASAAVVGMEPTFLPFENVGCGHWGLLNTRFILRCL